MIRPLFVRQQAETREEQVGRGAKLHRRAVRKIHPFGNVGRLQVSRGDLNGKVVEWMEKVTDEQYTGVATP